MNEIVIVGSGHAAAQLCGALAAAGQGARVHLVCEERELPYHRPPLSKGFLKKPDEPVQALRTAAWFADQGITIHLGDRASAIDRQSKTLTLASGRVLDYEWLALATGTRARHLPQLPTDLVNVHVLRTAADAWRLRDAWPGLQALTVLGGGFIGLEVAATARGLGKTVQVLESAPRLMQRSVSQELSEHVRQAHAASGIEVRTGVSVGGFEIRDGRLISLLADGEQLAVDNLLLGIGAAPEQALAQSAGLECDNGILVDACMRTSDPSILAIGDCAFFPEPTTGRRMRLESVQNANDQAKTAAATLLGVPQPHQALPWFWSEQGGMRLQIAGLIPVEAQRLLRPGSTPASFSILHYAQGQLACVESVNASADHLAARKLLESGRSPDPSQACDPAVTLKQLAD